MIKELLKILLRAVLINIACTVVNQHIPEQLERDVNELNADVDKLVKAINDGKLQ